MNYDELLRNNHERERYEALMDTVMERWRTRTEWKLVNEFFNIWVDSVTVELFTKNYFFIGVKVGYYPSEDVYFVRADDGKEIRTGDLGVIYEAIEAAATKKWLEGRDTR